jgi:dipeptidyl aminopeptidase/acylaminoacyl peptidase
MRKLMLCALALAPAAARADVSPNENLTVDGVPPIPDSLAAEAGAYAEYRRAVPLAWHPQRRELLISTRFGDTPQVHLVTTPLGDRRQLTFFPERVTDARFPPSAHRADHFVFARDTGGAERFQLYRYDLPSGNVTLLTDGKSRNELGRFSHAGVRLAYTSTRRNGKDTDLYVVDPRDPKSDRRLVELEGGGWRPLDWSPDSRQVLVQETISVAESYLWLIDGTDGTKELLTPKGEKTGEKSRYVGGAFSPDGRGIFTTTDKGSEFLRLAYVDLATKEHRVVSEGINWDVDEFELSHDGRTLAAVVNEDGVGTLHLFDVRGEREKPRPRLPSGNVHDLRFHVNGRDLAFAITAASHPDDVYSLDVVSGRVERWTESETGGLDVSQAAEPEIIKWPSFDGKMITGFLYLPPPRFAGPRPVMIDLHGGPESQFRPGYLNQRRYYLDVLGAALIFPNVRGSTGYGKAFTRLDNGARREDAVKDVGALLDWIRTRGELDPKRVMVTGGSYGGYLTLATSFRYADRLRASVEVVGISNLVSFLEHTEPYRRDLRRVEYGDERDPDMRAFFQKISPLNNVKGITRPLFVVHGRNDPRVPVAESEQIVAALKRQRTPVWYLVARDEGHGFAKKKNSDYLFFATVAFVRKYLLN